MPRTPDAHITNREATSDPTANDDASAGYDIGSRWINTSSQKVFFAVSVATGVAVWVDVSAGAASVDFDDILVSDNTGQTLTSSNTGNVLVTG